MIFLQFVALAGLSQLCLKAATATDHYASMLESGGPRSRRINPEGSALWRE
jgi:hypothetical protein